MICYLVLSILFSLGIAITAIEMYFSFLPLKKLVAVFILSWIIAMIIWPILLVFMDCAIIWNAYLKFKYGNITEQEPNEEEKI